MQYDEPPLTLGLDAAAIATLWGLAGGVPAAVRCPLRGPAGRRLIAKPRPRRPMAAAAP